MDRGYEAYCLVDPVFYDSPILGQKEEGGFRLARCSVPEGWERVDLDDWVVHVPVGSELPLQGWKVHASACLDNAEEILEAIWEYCVPRRITFKFIRSRDLLFLRNMKYAHRGSSGKFATIYPTDEAHLEVILNELGGLLDGQAGPYILSDLRWGEGPLYVRYGGFGERWCVGEHGQLELAIEDGDGQLVPDRRGPTFELPPWLKLPDCLEPHLAARNSATMAGLPYRIERALHFSNGGGVYAGTDERTEEQLILKEARPHAGLAMDAADAVTRLSRERDMLDRLAGLGIVPEVRDYFTVGGHHFLVQEFVDGIQLTQQFVERYPLTIAGAGEAQISEYAAWALDAYDQVERAVEAAHSRGVVIGDVHPSNVLVRPDGQVRLIDLEGSWDVGEHRKQSLADPAFIAPPSLTGFDVDRYALACLRLYLFMPLTALVSLSPGKAVELAREIGEVFPVPRGYLTAAADTITSARARSNGRPSSAPVRPREIQLDGKGWRAARDSMASGILASATPHREDRLFPGDIKQFPSGGLNIAFGAAGVLHALALTGAGRHLEHEDWLVQRALHPEGGTPPGFYDGLHGVAYVLDRLDRREDALKVLDIVSDDVGGQWERLGLDLYAGLAGVGLNLAHFAEATGDSSLWDAVWQVAGCVAGRLGEEDSVGEVSGGEHPHAGLTRGSSGPALLFLKLYDHSGDAGLLDLAATALGQDLRRCLAREDGSLQVDEDWRTMPYLADGSIGIGMVLDDYLDRRDDERFAVASQAIHKAAEAQFYIEPGLFWGRAGVILYLCRRHAPGTAARDPLVAAQVRRLAWHAMTYEGHLAFPGEYLMRFSMDLATGTAGVLLAMGAALHEQAVHLPFLDPVRIAARAPR